ncbi:DNA starvation/stationary phase protection protein Dps [Candidatus Foliamicus sp.]
MTVELHSSKIDLEEATRRRMVKVLNARLADAVNLATQMKQAHWNVKGPSFIALHELFDTIHADTLTQVDELAERITTLGGTALGTVAVAASESGLPDYPLDIFSGADHVESVSAALAAFGAGIRTAIAEAGDAGDADTEDLFVEISRAVDKNLWLVEAHAQA